MTTIPLSTPVRWSQYTGRVVEIVPAHTAPARFPTPGRIGLRDRVSYVVDCGGTRYWPTVHLRVVGAAIARTSTARDKRSRGEISISAGAYARLRTYAGRKRRSMRNVIESRLVAMLDAADRGAS